MNVPLRYTDHAVRDVPWWRSHVVRIVDPDPNPLPVIRIWKWWPNRRRRG